MATGPIERQKLRNQVYEQYKDKPEPTLLTGLELALRGFELSRRRLDNNVLEWDAYSRLRGHYNATASGILDAFNERGLTPLLVQVWKKYHAPLWMELEEPLYLTTYARALFEKLLPELTSPHSGLRALQKMLLQAQAHANANNPKNMAAISSNIEFNTTALTKAGFGMQTRALRSIFNYDSKLDFLWLDRFIGPNTESIKEQPAPPHTPVPATRPKGLQKCNPTSDPYDDGPDAIPQAQDPIGEPWEEALGAPAGALLSSSTLPKQSTASTRPKGLQKCKPASELDDITDDSFGM